MQARSNQFFWHAYIMRKVCKRMAYILDDYVRKMLLLYLFQRINNTAQQSKNSSTPSLNVDFSVGYCYVGAGQLTCKYSFLH